MEYAISIQEKIMKTYVFYIKGGDYMKRKKEDTHPRVQWRGWISETKSEESCLYSSMSDTQKSGMV